MFHQAVQVALKEHTLTGHASLRRLLTLLLIPMYFTLTILKHEI